MTAAGVSITADAVLAWETWDAVIGDPSSYDQTHWFRDLGNGRFAACYVGRALTLRGWQPSFEGQLVTARVTGPDGEYWLSLIAAIHVLGVGIEDVCRLSDPANRPADIEALVLEIFGERPSGVAP